MSFEAGSGQCLLPWFMDLSSVVMNSLSGSRAIYDDRQEQSDPSIPCPTVALTHIDISSVSGQFRAAMRFRTPMF